MKRLPKGIRRYQYIFCAWLWVWSIVFVMGWVTISPAISLILAAAVSNFLLWGTPLYRGTHWSKYMTVSMIEILLAVLFAVHLGGEKWSLKAIATNALVFAAYIMYLKVHGLHFSGIYLKKLPRLHNADPNQSVLGYIKSMFSG